MSLKNYVTLGHSGLRVSPLCLGCMTFGEDLGWGTSVQESNAIIDYFLEAGGNFLDTANVYTFGHSEKIIGDHIGRYANRRDRVVIATKFFGSLYDGDPNGGGANRKSIINACENSLRRLQTDYIDLYWMHAWDKYTPIEETMRTLDDLVKSGKVRYIGFSDAPAWKVAQAQTIARLSNWTPLIALQIEYNLLERTVEGELVPMAQELGLGITPWSPLKSGVLSGKYRRDFGQKADRGAWVENNLNEKAYNVVDLLVKIAEEIQSTPARIALAWVQSQPGVTSTIIGARRLEQLQDNLAALEVQLSSAHLDALKEVSKPSLNFPFDFLLGAGSFSNSGLTINGEANPVNPLVPKTDAQRY